MKLKKELLALAAAGAFVMTPAWAVQSSQDQASQTGAQDQASAQTGQSTTNEPVIARPEHDRVEGGGLGQVPEDAGEEAWQQERVNGGEDIAQRGDAPVEGTGTPAEQQRTFAGSGEPDQSMAQQDQAMAQEDQAMAQQEREQEQAMLEQEQQQESMAREEARQPEGWAVQVNGEMAEVESPVSDDLIRQLQVALNEEGQDIQVDGIWGPETHQALLNYQQDQNIDASGQLTPETLAELNLDEPRQTAQVEEEVSLFEVPEEDTQN